MLPHPDSTPRASRDCSARDSLGLMTVTLGSATSPLLGTAFVASLDATGLERVRREVGALAARETTPLTLEIAYVSTPASEKVLAPLTALEGENLVITRRRLASLSAGARPRDYVAPPYTARARPEPVARRSNRTPSPDPFGLDRAFHARWLPLLGFFADHYWRIAVDGLEHVPDEGPVLIAANHSGAVPADAAMLAATLARHHPARRRLRLLYDRTVEQLPLLPGFYRRFGGVPASLRNAETLLERGEAVGLFPEGVHGLEKTWRDRYRLRPFRSGTARLALRTGTPIVPVAIVGAEEAYPVVARLYRAGELVGLPWIPVTPLFPLCGVAGALPLPTKWHIRFGGPIMPPGPDANEAAVSALTETLRAAIDLNLTALLASRRGVFV